MDFIDIYADLTENEFRQYRRQYPEESNIMAGVIQRARDEGLEQGRAEGMQQGRVEGMQQGRAEGERMILERQLRRRFGPLPPETAERLRLGSAAELETWAESILRADTLGDVFDSGS